MSEEKAKVPVLVAEDDPDDRMLLEEALDGFVDFLDVRYVEDGQEMMEYLRDEGPSSPQPKLIFLDLNMPRKDGRQALKEIKGDERLKGIPVVIWTTSTLPEDVSLCNEIGADCFHSKPSSFAELSSTVKAIVRRFLEIPGDGGKERQQGNPAGQSTESAS